ncbi:MAG TPA: CDP-glycerol glycerophosphotransferase family protein [Magnetospirillum sp.]|nr:CDP-glycerol glycerophosphotransferase family protein [Magnetospirillum sp.]
MEKPFALVFQLGAGDCGRQAIAALAAQGWRVQVVAADVDVAVPPALAPMEVLTARHTDAIYAAANAWQRAMPGVRLAAGEALHDLRPWPDAPPAVWAWLNRLYPFVHVHIRLIELVHAAVSRFGPTGWAVVGDDPAFPWRRGLVERCLRSFCPQAQPLLPEPAVVVEAEQPPAEELRADVMPRPTPLRSAVRWLLRRVVPAKPRPVDPALTLAADALPPPTDIALVMRGKRGSVWHFNRQTAAWGVRDEYIENVPEAVIDACRAAGQTLTIIYHGEPPDTDDQRRGYAQRYPDVVREVATGPLSDFFRAHRRAVAKRIPADFHARYLADPAFAGAFSHRGVGYWDFLRPHAEGHIPQLVLAVLCQYEAWRVVFGRLAPKVVVGGRMEAVPTMTQAAHAVGARVVSVKLGVGQEMMPSTIADRPDGSYAADAFPDALAVWGEYQADLLGKEFPHYPGRVVATGRTRSDTFAADTLPRAEVRQRLGIPEDARLIVYAATARTHYARWPEAGHGACCLSLQGFEAGLRALAALADQRTWVLVKPHAADDLERIAALVAACGNPRVTLMRPGGAIHNADLLGASDVLASSLSSIFAEAVLLDCPAVNLWLPEVNFLYEEQRCRLYGRIAVTVETAEAMAEAVARLLNDPQARAAELARAKAALTDIIGPVDGRNAERVAALVMEMLSGR